jgi:O-antigen ligase
MRDNVRHEQINFLLLQIVIITYPFFVKICNVTIILCFVHWCIWWISKPKAFHFKNGMIWLTMLPYVLCAISLLYTKNVAAGIFVLDKKMSLLIFPLILGTIPKLSKEQVDKLLYTTCITLSAAAFICLMAAYYRYWQHIPGGFFWKDLTLPLQGFHPTYLSLCLNFMIAFLGIKLFSLWKTSSVKTKVASIVAIIFFYFLLALLSSKIQLIIAFIILLFLILQHSKVVNYNIAVPLIFVCIVITGWFLRDSYTFERFKHIKTFHYQLDAPVHTFNEFTIRLAIADCAMYILKDNLFFGIGAGDVNDELDKTYRKFDYKFGYLDQQNPHNEYLSQLLATGLIGLTVFAFTLGFPLRFAFQQKHTLYLTFIILFAVSFSVESFLERQKGIVFYALFNSLFLFHDLFHTPPKSMETFDI